MSLGLDTPSPLGGCVPVIESKGGGWGGARPDEIPCACDPDVSFGPDVTWSTDVFVTTHDWRVNWGWGLSASDIFSESRPRCDSRTLSTIGLAPAATFIRAVNGSYDLTWSVPGSFGLGLVWGRLGDARRSVLPDKTQEWTSVKEVERCWFIGFELEIPWSGVRTRGWMAGVSTDRHRVEGTDEINSWPLSLRLEICSVGTRGSIGNINCGWWANIIPGCSIGGHITVPGLARAASSRRRAE